ncbi:MAG: DNA internalization-related competence protein ComEC/Rec2 [Gemmatimonadales bacterium]
MKLPPVVYLLFGFGAGLATGLARFPDPRMLIPALAVAAGLGRHRSMLGLCLGAAIVGQLSAALAWQGESARCAARLPRGKVALTLVPVDPPPVANGRVEAEVLGAGCTGMIDVRWPSGVGSRGLGGVQVGIPIHVEGTWYPRPEGPFDRPGGILVVQTVLPPPSHFAHRTSHALNARRALLATTLRLYGDHAPLVDALLFDRRGAIDRDTRDRFAASGLVHLLSISGFHVGLIIGWTLILLRVARLRREHAWILATLLGLCYVAWLGWPAPATRAAALALVMCLARLRQRVVRWDALLATTALAVLLVDPWAITDLGAWLSVTSLAGATMAVQWSDLRLGTHPLVRTLTGSVGATVATAPLTAGALGSVALAGIGLNFIGIPLAAITVPAVLLSVLLGPLWPWGAAATAAGGGALLALLDRLAALGAALPYGHFTVETGWWGALPWLVAMLVVFWCIAGRATGVVALTRATVAVGTALWLALGASGWAARPFRPSPGLTLTFLDVGQGDATALQTPGGHWVVIDAGPAGEGRDAGRSVVAPFLARHGVRRIEAVVLSHAHLDHYGGIGALFDRFEVARLLEPAAAVDDPGYRALLDRVGGSGAAWSAFRRGDTLRVDGVEIIALHPDTAWTEWGLDLNEDSDVVLVRYGAFEALMAGDAGLPAESDMRGQVGDVEVLKVGHHGSAGASGEGWLAELRPEIAVISVGRGNRYHHPSAGALGRLGAAGAEVWRTDEVGTVEVWTDGATVKVSARGRRRVLPARR